MPVPSVLARRVTSTHLFFVLAPLLLLSACAPGELKAGLGPDETVPVEVAVVADSAAIIVGETVDVHATARNASGQQTPAAIDWSASGGTLVTLTDSTARFSASAPGSYRIRGRHRSTPNPTDSTTIMVATPAPVLQAVILAPSSAALTTGATQQFSVSGQWSNGATTAPSVAYTATGGMITSGGLYTAASTAGSFRVIATQQGGLLADTSSVTLTVTPPVLQAVILTPPSTALSTGATQQFSVTGQWSNGATTAPSVTYSATGGSITTGGLYTAGSTAGSFRVIATQQGGALADTSTVTLTTTPPVLQAVILTPSSAALTTGATQQFSVTGQWSNSATTAPSVTYSATGGTITTGGLYTAGSTAGSFRVIATQQGGTLADTAALAITSAHGTTPWLVEDFSGYANTTALRSASWLRDGDYTRWGTSSGMSLDSTEGYGTSTKSMKASWNTGDKSLGVYLDLPANTTEYWTEIWVKLSTSFTSVGTSGDGNPDFKFVFWMLDAGSGRNEIKIGEGGWMNKLSARYNNGPDTPRITAASTLASGKWYRYRAHNKLGNANNAVFNVEFWDGTNAPQLFRQENFSLGAFTYMNYMQLGSYMNQYVAAPMWLKWGKITLYNQDPGWGF